MLIAIICCCCMCCCYPQKEAGTVLHKPQSIEIVHKDYIEPEPLPGQNIVMIV